MKNLFSKIPFNTKLVLLAVIPIIFVIILSINAYNTSNENLRNIEIFQKEFYDSKLLNSLIENVQQERRTSVGFLLKQYQKTELLFDRKATDNALSDLKTSEQVNSQLIETYSSLDRLDSIRKAIDESKIRARECLEIYTSIINRSNNLLKFSPNNLPGFETIQSDIYSYKLLTSIISRFGITRSNLGLFLQSNGTDSSSQSIIKNSNDVLESYEDEFINTASKKYAINLNNILNAPEYKIYLKTIRNHIADTKNSVNLSNENWWASTTNIIYTLQNLKAKMFKELGKATEKAYQEEKSARNLNLIMLLLMLLLVLTVVVYTINSLTNSLAELKSNADKLALGETGLKFKFEARDVIYDLSQAVKKIDLNAQIISEASNEIGRGNFGVNINPRSKEDLLGHALLTMKNSLEIYDAENQHKLWSQNGMNTINVSIRGEKNLETLSKNILEGIHRFFENELGALYVTDDSQNLKFIASLGVQNEENIPKNIPNLEGQLGKMAKENVVKQIVEMPEQYFIMQSGLGSALPKNLIFIPLYYDKQLEGIIELASLDEFTTDELNLLQEMSEPVAIAIKAAKSREQLEELLEETQAQSEELQTQQTELESMNSELEAQSQSLQASEEELRVQQEELQQTNVELERRGSDLSIKNDEIRKKAEELELSTKYKSEFLANMSHELRTPLNSILLLSRLLSENHTKNLSEEQMEFAKVIQNSGSGLLHLIDEILDLSKIEAGKMDVELEEVNITNFVDEIYGLFHAVAQEKEIEFKVVNNTAKDFKLKTDEMKLGQIIKNLISNALKFTPKGKITLESAPCKINPNYHCFHVIDNGIGISKEKQKLIFEAFQQEDGSTKRKYGGTGLGLSISRELVRLLGGEITVESEQGNGSKFTIFMPLNTESSEKMAPLIKETKFAEIIETKDDKVIFEKNINSSNPLYTDYISDKTPEQVKDDRKNLKAGDKIILIVEDDVNFALSLVKYSNQRGYKAISCVQGDQAITMAKLYKPVGILLDVELPVMSGWEIIDLLKAETSTKHIPVHMMSSHKMKKTGMNKGAIDFIEKPLAYEKMDDIFEKIEHVLAKHPKKILIIEDNEKHATALAHFLRTYDIHAEVQQDLKKGLETLKNKELDCVVLDMGIPDQSAYDLLESVKHSKEFEDLPIIVFTGKSLSEGEEMRIRKYADTIVVKTAHSYQRMLDEVSLFLHIVEDNTQGGDKMKQHRDTFEEILENKTILIADDDVRNIFSLTKILETYRVNVISAMDGKEALQKLQENPQIDLVLLDMMMPKMDGYETAQAIRKTPSLRKLPIIAVTAKAMTGDREKCIKAGASDYITKPVDIDQLLSLLRVWLYA